MPSGWLIANLSVDAPLWVVLCLDVCVHTDEAAPHTSEASLVFRQQEEISPRTKPVDGVEGDSMEMRN